MRQLVYFSTAAERQDAITVAGIVAVSRNQNLRHKITGLLVAGGHRYLQVIEGPAHAITQLVGRLRGDDRHVGMTVLVDRDIVARSFTGWSMAFREEPRLGEYATFSELVAQMRLQLADAKLRKQLDCFARSFSSATTRIATPLWQLAPRDLDYLAVDRRH